MSATVWHDLECGRYAADLPLWSALASKHVAPEEALLDIGAGTGRVSLALAELGHRVVALDHDPELLKELERRAVGYPIETLRADARTFEIPGRRFPLVLVPMQTIQLLGGESGRAAFLSSARAHLTQNGVLAVAIASSHHFEEFQWHEGDATPLPDVFEVEGTSYFSQPTAVRRERDGYVLERRRERVDARGTRTVTADAVTLDELDVQGLREAGQRAGLHPVTVLEIPRTDEHVASEVVILGA